MHTLVEFVKQFQTAVSKAREVMKDPTYEASGSGLNEIMPDDNAPISPRTKKRLAMLTSLITSSLCIFLGRQMLRQHRHIFLLKVAVRILQVLAFLYFFRTDRS